MDEEQLPCAKKLGFDSEKEARAAATTLEWQKGTKLKTYQCRHCGLWHLSSAN